MDSNTAIGNVDQFILITTDTLGAKVETGLSKKFIGNASATYANVDTAMRALATMSTNNYSDTTCVTSISVNDVMSA